MGLGQGGGARAKRLPPHSPRVKRPEAAQARVPGHPGIPRRPPREAAAGGVSRESAEESAERPSTPRRAPAHVSARARPRGREGGPGGPGGTRRGDVSNVGARGLAGEGPAPTYGPGRSRLPEVQGRSGGGLPPGRSRVLLSRVLSVRRGSEGVGTLVYQVRNQGNLSILSEMPP